MKFNSLFILIFFSFKSYAYLCPLWEISKKIGELDLEILKETSGLAISKIFPDRLYHVNDSGSGPYFYTTNFNGTALNRHEVSGVKFKDVEDLGLGKCEDQTCLYIADIGDNKEKRKSAKLILIEEKKVFSKKIIPKKIIKFKYPDGAHNAEGLAVHPNGDIYLITKNTKLINRSSHEVSIFKLTKDQMANADETKMMEKVAVLDISKFFSKENYLGQRVTSFDFSPDGSKFLLLTYKASLEFNYNLATDKIPAAEFMKKATDYNIVDLTILPQQESIAYLPSGHGFIYNTEFKKEHGYIPLIQVNCARNL